MKIEPVELSFLFCTLYWCLTPKGLRNGLKAWQLETFLSAYYKVLLCLKNYPRILVKLSVETPAHVRHITSDLLPSFSSSSLSSLCLCHVFCPSFYPSHSSSIPSFSVHTFIYLIDTNYTVCKASWMVWMCVRQTSALIGTQSLARCSNSTQGDIQSGICPSSEYRINIME